MRKKKKIEIEVDCCDFCPINDSSMNMSFVKCCVCAKDICWPCFLDKGEGGCETDYFCPDHTKEAAEMETE